MKILLGNFSAKVCNEDIFKATVGTESLHEISNVNGVRVKDNSIRLNIATSKNITVKSTIFQHHNINNT
jgi:hypothetical protein